MPKVRARKDHGPQPQERERFHRRPATILCWNNNFQLEIRTTLRNSEWKWKDHQFSNHITTNLYSLEPHKIVHEFVRFADEHILQKSMESPHSSPSVAWSENSITQYSRAFYLLRQQNTVIAHHKIPGWKQMVIYTIAKSSHTHSLLESHKDTHYTIVAQSVFPVIVNTKLSLKTYIMLIKALVPSKSKTTLMHPP